MANFSCGKSLGVSHRSHTDLKNQKLEVNVHASISAFPQNCFAWGGGNVSYEFILVYERGNSY